MRPQIFSKMDVEQYKKKYNVLNNIEIVNSLNSTNNNKNKNIMSKNTQILRTHQKHRTFDFTDK